jgi:hypothetical protein
MVGRLERHGHRGVVAVEHGDLPAGAQHAVRLGDRALPLRHVAERRVEDDRIEARVVELERPSVARDGHV